jgi:hypothetical protein
MLFKRTRDNTTYMQFQGTKTLHEHVFACNWQINTGTFWSEPATDIYNFKIPEMSTREGNGENEKRIRK